MLYRSDQIIKYVFPFDLMKTLTFFDWSSVEVGFCKTLRIDTASPANSQTLMCFSANIFLG